MCHGRDIFYHENCDRLLILFITVKLLGICLQYIKLMAVLIKYSSMRNIWQKVGAKLANLRKNGRCSVKNELSQNIQINNFQTFKFYLQ